MSYAIKIFQCIDQTWNMETQRNQYASVQYVPKSNGKGLVIGFSGLFSDGGTSWKKLALMLLIQLGS
jgi:hypothetical protein